MVLFRGTILATAAVCGDEVELSVRFSLPQLPRESEDDVQRRAVQFFDRCYFRTFFSNNAAYVVTSVLVVRVSAFVPLVPAPTENEDGVVDL